MRRAVQVEVPAVDPELAEAEPHRQGRCPAPCRRRPAARARASYMFCGVWMSQSLSGFHFSVKAMRPSLRSPRRERLAGELADAAAVVGDLRRAGRSGRPAARPSSAASKRDLPFAHRGVHLHVGDPRPGRRADQVDVAAQAAPRHRALHLPGRGGVAVGEHDALAAAWRRTSRLSTCLPPGRQSGGEVHLAAGEADLARLLAVHVHGRVGIQVLRRQGDAAAGPCLGNRDLPLDTRPR